MADESNQTVNQAVNESENKNPVQIVQEFFESANRVLTISKKPTWKEFSTMAKITGVGIIVIGLIGYIVTLVFTILGVGQ